MTTMRRLHGRTSHGFYSVVFLPIDEREVSMPATISIPLETPALEIFAKAGILSDRSNVPDYLKLFAEQADQVLESAWDGPTE